jgi:hypothetical protein
MMQALEAIQAVEALTKALGVTQEDEQWIYVTDPSYNNCEHCLGHDGQVFTRNEELDIIDIFPDYEQVSPTVIYPNVHMTLWGKKTCCLKGTLISTKKGLIPIEEIKLGDLILTHKNRFRPVTQLHINMYEGQIHNIKGSWLTSNHPVLTTRGWVKAEGLNESDYILNIKSFSLIKSVNFPAFFFKKGSFFGIHFPYSFGIVPLNKRKIFIFIRSLLVHAKRTINFNGNFQRWNRKINVENIQSVQWNDFYSFMLKSLKKQHFQFTKFSVRLINLGSFNKKIMSSRTHLHRFMIRFNLMVSLLLRHFTPFQLARFTLSSSMNTCINQTSSDNLPRNTIFYGDNILRDTIFNIKPDDFINGQFNPSHQVATPLSYIYKEQFKGLVYNLSVAEDETYCVGKDQMIVHNCKCQLFLSNLAKLDDYKPEKPIFGDIEKEKSEKLIFVGPEKEKPVIPLPDKTILPEPKPIDLGLEQKELTGNQYADFLGSLLSLGYITLAAYAVIMNRRQGVVDVNKQEIIEALKNINTSDNIWVEIEKLLKDR